MRRKTRRRKRRRKGGVGDKSATTRRERRRLALNERRRRRRFERALPEGEYPNFAKIVANAKFKAAPTVTEHEVEQERIRFEPTRLEFLRSGQEIALDSPLRKGKQGGRQYPKTRTHVYSRATPTHNIAKKSRSRRSKSKSMSRSRRRSRSRSRSRSRRRRRRKRTR